MPSSGILHGMDHAPAPDVEAPDTRWPKVLGIISLIYAIGGMLCAIGLGVSIPLAGVGFRMQGLDIQLPQVMTLQAVIFAVLQFILGCMLIVAAAGLLRRVPAGVRWARRWAILRLVLLVLGLGVAIVTGQAQIEFEKQMLNMRREQMRQIERDPDSIPEKSDQQIWRGVLLKSLIFTGCLAVYPVFLGLFLSRRAVNEEISRW